MNIRSLMVLTVLLFATISANAQTADHTGYYCGDCRNIVSYPHDAANFALNQVWGPTEWMTAQQSLSGFGIVDPFGNVVSINIDVEIEGISITIPLIEWEIFITLDDVILEITVRDEENVVVHADDVSTEDTDFPLPVGGGGGGGGGDSSSGGGGGGGGRGGRRGGGGGNYCGPGTEYYCVQR